MPKPAKRPAPRGANKHRDSEIKKIQIAKRWALANLPGFDDDRYRDLLQEAGGKRSCTEMDWRGRTAVLQRFQELGWVPAPAKGARPAPDRPCRRLADDDQSKMIRGLWIDLHTLGEVRDPSEKSLNSFVKRMTHIADLHWCGDNHKYTLIEALKDMRARRTITLLESWSVTTFGTAPPKYLLPDLQVVLRGLRIGEVPQQSSVHRLGFGGYQLLVQYKQWEAATYGV